MNRLVQSVIATVVVLATITAAQSLISDYGTGARLKEAGDGNDR